MSNRNAISILTVAAALSFTSLEAGSARPAPQLGQSSSQSGFQVDSQVRPPSDAEIRARAQELLANQHKDDDRIDEYERIERHLDRTGGPNTRTLEDKTYRILPTGAGNFKILLKDGGKATDPAEYNRQLQAWANVLNLMLKPNDSRAKAAYAKYDKRKRDRAEFVAATRDAFVGKWLAQETWNGRLCDVFQLDPNPEFHPHSIFQDALTHAMGKIWVDHGSDHLVRGEAHITRDISFGGGILGKLYRGGVFSLEQAEVAPGVWLPTRYQYDFSGRRFLFAFEQHQLIEVSHYRRVGPPKEALAVAQYELATGKTFSPDP